MAGLVPYITTAITLAAFFAALYFRSVRDFSRHNIDSIKSLSTLPSRSRLEAMRLVINTFDLDTKNMTAAQQYKLAIRTFEKREADSRRRFYLLIMIGIAFLLASITFLVFSWNSPEMVVAALVANRKEVASHLKEVGFFEDRDPSLLDHLVDQIPKANSISPFQRALDLENALQRQPLIAQMRARASIGEAPFQQVGEILTTGVPAEMNGPPRYIAYVQINSPLVGSILDIQSKTNDKHIKLFARGAIDAGDGVQLQLNSRQYQFLAGDKLRTVTTKLLAKPAHGLEVYDPTCAAAAPSSPDGCAGSATITAKEIPALQR